MSSVCVCVCFKGQGTHRFMVHPSVVIVEPVVHLVPRNAAVVAFTLRFQKAKSVCRVRCYSPAIDF